MIEENENQGMIPLEGRRCFNYETPSRVGMYVPVLGGLALGTLIVVLEDGEAVWWVILILLLLMAFFVLVFELSHRFAEGMRVCFDYDRRVVALERVAYAQSFWDVFRKKYVEIPFDDFVGVVYASSRHGSAHFVYTKESKFHVGDSFENYHLMIGLFREISNDSGGVPLKRNMWVLSGVAGIAGLLIVFVLGWLLGWI